MKLAPRVPHCGGVDNGGEGLQVRGEEVVKESQVAVVEVGSHIPCRTHTACGRGAAPLSLPPSPPDEGRRTTVVEGPPMTEVVGGSWPQSLGDRRYGETAVVGGPDRGH